MQVAKSNRNRYLMYTVVILFWLVMVTSGMVAHLYAKYESEGLESDAGRVAGFNVGAKGSYKEGYSNVLVSVLESDKPGVYYITVENKSEVDVRYDIIFKYGNKVISNTGLKQKMNITLADFDNVNKRVQSPDLNTITFSDVGILESNGGSKSKQTKTMNFNISAEDYYDNMVAGETFDFDIDVRFVQVD